MDYIEKQKLVIDTTINLTKKAGARGLLKGVRNLTDYFALNAKDFPDTTNGMEWLALFSGQKKTTYLRVKFLPH